MKTILFFLLLVLLSACEKVVEVEVGTGVARREASGELIRAGRLKK
jgi:hypothetical protein